MLPLDLGFKSLTIEEELAKFGFRHERDEHSFNDGKHRIFDDQGRDIGRMDAIEASRLLNGLRYGVDDPQSGQASYCIHGVSMGAECRECESGYGERVPDETTADNWTPE